MRSLMRLGTSVAGAALLAAAVVGATTVAGAAVGLGAGVLPLAHAARATASAAIPPLRSNRRCLVVSPRIASPNALSTVSLASPAGVIIVGRGIFGSLARECIAVLVGATA